MPLIFDIKVVPSSGRQSFKLDKSSRLKCYLKSAPEKGKANLELLKFVAKLLKIPLDQVEIVAGATSRNKRIRVDLDIGYNDLLLKFGIEVQQKIFEY